ncbi:MAG: hypothetical protein K6G88_10930 [Lachnospiraceae bacterium]|nr:hypothetical protein [Lachnospiraceae bacterium]
MRIEKRELREFDFSFTGFTNAIVKTAEAVEENLMSYFDNDKRIQSLAKEKMGKVVRSESVFVGLKISRCCDSLFSTLRYLAAACKYYKKEVISLLNNDLDTLNGRLAKHDIEISELVGRGLEADIARSKSKTGYTKLFCAEIVKDDVIYYQYGSDVGTKSKAVERSWCSTSTGEVAQATDIVNLVCLCFLIDDINKELKKSIYEDVDLLSDYLSVYDIYVLYRTSKQEDILPFLDLPMFGSDDIAKQILGEKARNIRILDDNYIRMVCDRHFELIPRKDTVSFKRKYVADDVTLLYFLDNYRFLMKIDRIIKTLCVRAEARERNYKHEHTVSGDYARSFQTKKNIPNATVKAMKNSRFNNFFGFVEFDELVDLKKIEEIEKEFEAFNLFLFGEKGLVTKNVELRFRRLGNHKAAGLYYPFFNCICIDINNPGSFVHEYGHMLDYTNGNASEKAEFYSLRELYCDAMKRAVKEQDIKLKGKYNMDYYSTPTEVFARCFELYMFYCRKMSNNILKDIDGFAYPNDELFLKHVDKYFTAFFEKYSKKESIGGEQKCAST